MQQFDTSQLSPADAAAFGEVSEFLHDFEWRITNLYKIKDVTGKAVQFTPNWAQDHFLDHMHYFNVILKARQLGFTTFIAIYFLDACLFWDNHSCGIIAQGLKEAGDIFDNKIKFAYDNLPNWMKEMRPTVADNTTEMEFSNGSKITVGLSLRSGTFQKLHVSEYGKTSAQFPDKAKEIKTGAFNTVHQGQQIFVESTAEGQGGEFFELVKTARKLQDEGRELSTMDPKFHFYPWFKNPDYFLPTGDTLRTVIDDEHNKYFHELQTEHGIVLTNEQKAWYFKKSETMGEDMRREFPSTPDESFAASVEGAIYAKQMRILRKNGQITRVPWEPKSLVHTFWDFGNFNYMAIWFFQQIGREWRMIRFYQNSGQDFTHYVDYMRDLGYSYGTHWIPHDGDVKRLAEKNKSYKQIMTGLGLSNIKTVPVTRSVWQDIDLVCKPALLKVWIDQVNCADGIKCLDSYRKVRNKDGIWLNEPKHDEFSDGSDAFRTFAVGYKEKIATAPVSFQLGQGERQL